MIPLVLGAKHRALLLGLAVIIAASIVLAWKRGQEPLLPVPEDIKHYVYWQASELTDLDLRRSGDQPLRLRQLQGQWVLLFLGYTHCPDVCPGTLAVVAEACKLIDQGAGGVSPVQGLFVSVDPQRDTPERLAEYVAYFHPRFLGATAKPETLEELARTLGAPFIVQAAEGGSATGNYQVAHSATVFVIDPRGRLFARFPPPQDPVEMAAAFQKMRAYYQQKADRRWVLF